MRRLSAFPVRRDHTDRECAEFLTGIVAGLCSIADPEQVRNAFRYWAGNESQHEWDAVAKLLRSEPPPKPKPKRITDSNGKLIGRKK